MSIPQEWLFPASVEEAVKTQRLLAAKVSLEDSFPPPKCIGGMDVSNNLYDPEELIYASAVTLSYPELKPQAQAATRYKQHFPYIPGLLGFREAPALVEAFQILKSQTAQLPNVWMIDGHGISHPRGLGIASHLGVLLDIPTIGVAKSILVGRPAEPLGSEVGSTTPLIWKNQTLGILLRSKTRCNPLIISPGHKISLSTAVELVKSCVKGPLAKLHAFEKSMILRISCQDRQADPDCRDENILEKVGESRQWQEDSKGRFCMAESFASGSRGYRLPEPTRQAHLAANACRKQHLCAIENTSNGKHWCKKPAKSRMTNNVTP